MVPKPRECSRNFSTPRNAIRQSGNLLQEFASLSERGLGVRGMCASVRVRPRVRAGFGVPYTKLRERSRESR